MVLLLRRWGIRQNFYTENFPEKLQPYFKYAVTTVYKAILRLEIRMTLMSAGDEKVSKTCLYKLIRGILILIGWDIRK